MQRHPSRLPVETAKSVPPDLIGSELAGRYRIDARLGAGGFGVVYRAWDQKRSQGVAVKVLRAELSSRNSLKGRFRREAKALMALEHPNIVAITDYGVVDGVPYLAMELLEGHGLDRELKDGGPLSEARALFVFSELLGGIGYMHERGLVHRDLKPGNVFVQQLPNGRDCIKLLDFGLAKFLESDAEGADVMTLTRSGEVFGTPAFMPPEQLAGGNVDRRADIYSAAVVMFQMLSGRRPFEGEPYDVLRKVLVEQPPTMASMRPDVAVHPALEAWFQRSLAKEPGERHDSAEALLSALEAIPRPWLRDTDEITTKAVSGAFAHAETMLQGQAQSSHPPPGPTAPRTSPVVAFVKAALRRVLVASAALVSLVSVLVIGVAAAVIYLLSSEGGDLALLSPEPARDVAAAGDEPVDGEDAVAGAGGHGAVAVADDGTKDVAEEASAVGAPEGSEEPPTDEPPPDEEPAEEEPVDGPAVEASAVGQQAVDGSPPEAAASRPRARDPFLRGTPRALVTIRKRIAKGYAGNERMLKALRRYNRNHPRDARGHLLLARMYINRRWYSDAVGQYGFAYARDPSARGDRHMLPDLVMLAGEDSAFRDAAKLVRDAYGAEAITAVERAHGRAREANVKRRLARLRRMLGDPK